MQTSSRPIQRPFCSSSLLLLLLLLFSLRAMLALSAPYFKLVSVLIALDSAVVGTPTANDSRDQLGPCPVCSVANHAACSRRQTAKLIRLRLVGTDQICHAASRSRQYIACQILALFHVFFVCDDHFLCNLPFGATFFLRNHH